MTPKNGATANRGENVAARAQRRSDGVGFRRRFWRWAIRRGFGGEGARPLATNLDL